MLFYVMVNDKNNLFYFIYICNVFWYVVDEIDCDIKNCLVIFKLFDKYVIFCYDLVLDVVNLILVEVGILFDLKGSFVMLCRFERCSVSVLLDI